MRRVEFSAIRNIATKEAKRRVKTLNHIRQQKSQEEVFIFAPGKNLTLIFKPSFKMKHYIISLLAVLVAHVAFAQFPGGAPAGGEGRRTQQSAPSGMNSFNQKSKGIGKISGTILDSIANKGIEYANIVLYNSKTNDVFDGTVTDEKGKFALEGLTDGNYKIVISFLGYADKTLDDIKIVKEKTVALGNIMLAEDTETLGEVTVTGQKALIEEKVDRLVYNAEKDDLAKGGDAADVLRKVPLLQVDLEGNVSLRGSSNIRVLINNKPSTIVASSIADALQMIPADMIKTVEVITSPSAKYDAEGSAGIINIITKKDKLEGYNLNVDVGAGVRGSNLGLNGSLRQGKFGLTLGGRGRLIYNKAENDMEQTTFLNGITNTTKQSADATDNGIFGSYSLGMDYDIDKTQAVSGGVRYGIRSFQREQFQITELYNDDLLQSTSFRDILTTDASHNVDMNLDYIRIFKPQQEWSISTQYSRNDLVNDFVSDNLNSDGLLLNSLKNLNDNLNEEITLQTDYITPISDNQSLELGAKGILRTVNSDFSYFFADGSTTDYNPDYTRPSGTLNYQQNVTAAYSSYTYSTPSKYTFKAGLRWENTSINAEQDDEVIELPDYNNFVPSLNVSKSLKGFTTLKLGYNRRIQRPGLQQLNPNFNISNNQDVRVGNPNLEPELTDNLELGLSTMIKKTYINVSVFGRTTDNAINQVRTPIDSIQGAILTTYENIGKQRSLGTNWFTNIYLTDKWTLNGGVDVYYTFLEGQVAGENGTSITIENSGLNFGGRLMSQLQLKKGWGVQAFTFMRGRQVQLQGINGGFGMYALGFRKNFTNNKGSIGFSAENFASRGWNVRTELESPQLTQTSNMLLLNRNFKVNLTYKFGKLTFADSRSKTRSVKNDDVIGGGDSMGGDAGGGGDSAAPSRAGRQAPNGGAPRTAPQPSKEVAKDKKAKPEKKD